MMEVFKKFSLYKSHETIAIGSNKMSAKDESKDKATHTKNLLNSAGKDVEKAFDDIT